MPPHLITEATPFVEAIAATKVATTATAHAHGTQNTQNIAQNPRPSLTQHPAAAAKMGGIAPESAVQEARPPEPTNVPRPYGPGPSLTQLSAAAAEMGGIAPEPMVQEARQTKSEMPVPVHVPEIGPQISMQEFADAERMQEDHHVQEEQEDEPPSIQVAGPYISMQMFELADSMQEVQHAPS